MYRWFQLLFVSFTVGPSQSLFRLFSSFSTIVNENFVLCSQRDSIRRSRRKPPPTRPKAMLVNRFKVSLETWLSWWVRKASFFISETPYLRRIAPSSKNVKVGPTTFKEVNKNIFFSYFVLASWSKTPLTEKYIRSKSWMLKGYGRMMAYVVEMFWKHLCAQW